MAARNCEGRFIAFMSKIIRVSGFQPRENYLYQLMYTTSFTDLETALEVAIENHEEACAAKNSISPAKEVL